jgi:isoaspartyl peptidase/L-asparaginase-like protein (Ntn-hydrolase superfamily)
VCSYWTWLFILSLSIPEIDKRVFYLVPGFTPMGVLIVTHVGAGSTQKVIDAAEKAGKIGLEILKGGGVALDAVEEAIVSMENDERTNAGIGSRLRMSGKIQMDASLMDSDRN